MSTKVFAWITLLTGLSLSAVAGFYSVVGLSTIFVDAFWSVAILASLMELAKLVAVSWMYRYHYLAGIGMKSYLSIAIVVLMLITSLGVFGYLSRAHVSTGITVAQAESSITLLQEQENALRTKYTQLTNELNTTLQQDNQLVTQLGDAQRLTLNNGAVQVQREQSARREALRAELNTITNDLAAAQQTRIAAQGETALATADVGPLRYLAQIMYGSDDAMAIQRAMLWLTILLMSVFDPLAVVLLVAANVLFLSESGQKRSDLPKIDPVGGPPAGLDPPVDPLPAPDPKIPASEAPDGPVTPNIGATDIPKPLWRGIDH